MTDLDILITDHQSLEHQIKQHASELGFAKCGITSADPPTYHQDFLRWLEDGFAGNLGYMHRQAVKRGDITRVLPGARSVVIVAMNYYSGAESPALPHSGVVARYARFNDYHETMWSRLAELLAFTIERSPGIHGKAYCDTGPITERDYAMRSGIGWIGKHTNLISRSLGNWFFLGALVLDVALQPDAPETQHCGTCQRCLPACPTGAIVAPYRLDARKCISYLTIELKGSIPVDLRPFIGNRIYGCDDCLAVCPWNKFAVKNEDPVVGPQADLCAADLNSLLDLDDDAFNYRFANSPIMRTKRRGLLRNVCVALGNVGDSTSLPQLDRARTDKEPLIQEHAAWAITEINSRAENS